MAAVAIPLDYMDGATALLSLELSASATTDVPCAGRAVVVTKSSKTEANGVCPPQWTAMSCSCVEPLTNSTEWSFNLRLKAKTPETSAVGDSIGMNNTLAITTIGQFMLPDYVRTLRLTGEKQTPPAKYDLELTSAFKSDITGAALVAYQSENQLKRVAITNVDLALLDISVTFLPPSVEEVTLRNCNLDTFPWGMILRLAKLRHIDISHNRMISLPDNSDVYDDLLRAVAVITTVNASANLFTSIPPILLALPELQHLDFSQNPVTNFTVSTDVFSKINSLQTFILDATNSTSAKCEGPDRAWQITHDARLCVVSPPSTTNSSSNSSADTALVYGAVGGSVVIVLLLIALFFLHRRKQKASRDKALSQTTVGEPFASMSVRSGFQARHAGSTTTTPPILGDFDGTLSLSHMGQSHPTIDPTLLRDPLIITSRLDHKELLFGEALKSGGFGVVYTGVYKRRRVAIKQIRPEHTGDTRLLESFLKEIALMASLSHPRIVEYIGCAWDSLRNLSVVTELMARGDLREVLQFYKHQRMLNGSGNGSASGNVDGVTTLSWANGHKTRLALHIAEGLQYLHTLSPKVIHRDLKSKNVLVSSEFEAKLTDFGISREGRFEQTHMTAGIGTSFWIAPEVLAGVRYDERADIFSFGVVLSELDTDDFPYWNARSAGAEGGGGGVEDRGATQEGLILRRVLAGEMRPQFSESCPLVIKVLADQCLEGDPSKRPTASEIVQYLMPLPFTTLY